MGNSGVDYPPLGRAERRTLEAALERIQSGS
jgi:hypothetical protein